MKPSMMAFASAGSFRVSSYVLRSSSKARPSGPKILSMTDRPIIFSGPMVRALLAGRKTQTRRLATSPLARCAVGDRLYVRETAAAVELDTGQDGIRFAADAAFQPIANTAEAAEAWGVMHWYGRAADADLDPTGKQVPSIHMPRWASRLTLIVEAVRVEPLQASTWDDARAEGLDALSKDGKLVKYGISDRDGLPGNDDDGWHWQEWNVDPTAAYARLWSTLHTKPGERWEDNPAVVALTFRVLRGNIDEVTA